MRIAWWGRVWSVVFHLVGLCWKGEGRREW